jgi:cytochrome P450
MFFTTAGSETTATALSGIMNYLTTSGNEATVSSLVREVRESFKSEDEITFEKLASLQYLNATINEGMRLCPPVPTMLPRLVPEGGDTVCGMWMPAGVSLFFLSYFQRLIPSSLDKRIATTLDIKS